MFLCLFLHRRLFKGVSCGLRSSNESDAVLGIVMNWSTGVPSLLAVLFVVIFSEQRGARFTRM